MSVEPTTQPAATAGTVTLGDLVVNRMAFGAMRLNGPAESRGEPLDPKNAKGRVLRRAVELGVKLHRHRCLIRGHRQRTPGRGGAAPVSRAVS